MFPLFILFCFLNMTFVQDWFILGAILFPPNFDTLQKVSLCVNFIYRKLYLIDMYLIIRVIVFGVSWIKNIARMDGASLVSSKLSELFALKKE